MRKTTLGALLLLGAWVIPAAGARADDFGFGISISNEGRKNFFLAASTHFKMPGTTVGLCVKKGIPDEEFPVVCYLATRARVKPEALIKLRLQGRSWADITIGLGLGAEIFYVPIKVAAGPPYGNAYGHFKKGASVYRRFSSINRQRAACQTVGSPSRKHAETSRRDSPRHTRSIILRPCSRTSPRRAARMPIDRPSAGGTNLQRDFL